MAFSPFGKRALCIFVLATSALARAQSTANGRVVLVLPFENRSGNASLNWVGDSFPDTLDKRLNSAGFLTISHDDRAFALDHLGLPTDFRPSRATTIRIAQQLDANYVIVGSYTVQPVAGGGASNDKIAIQSQVLTVDALTLSKPVEDGAELNRLFDAENAIAWKVARVIDPRFTVAEQTFLAAPGAVPLPAFEDYIRGTTAPTAAERLKRLQAAIVVTPDYPAALLALGKEQYAAKDYASAATTLAKVPQTSQLALEASFYLGLSRFNTNNYDAAATAFQFVAAHLPLPEVINNQAVSLSRQNKDAADLFRKASSADPNDEDYHYNLAVSLFRRGDTANALAECDAALKLKPNDNDVGELRARISLAGPGTKLPPNPVNGFTPVERIRRTYSEASFRQAEFQLNQLRDARLAMLPPAQRATEYVAAGRDDLNQHLLPEAEQQFESALAADPRSFQAHAGLARIRVDSGNTLDAHSEALISNNLQPNVEALLLLAQLDLDAGQLAAAADDVSRALRVEPKNSAAIAFRLVLQQRGQAVP